MNKYPSKEELRELYRKMPIEEFSKFLHKELKDYTQEAIDVIREIARERKNEIDSYFLNEQKEYDKKINITKEKWAEIESKYRIFKTTSSDRKLEKAYNEIASNVDFYLTKSYRELDIFKDFEDILGSFFDFDLPAIDEVIQRLKEFDVILDKKLAKNRK